MLPREAILAAARSWPPAAGDTNLVDVAHHAGQILTTSGIVLPTELPDKERGVAIVEAVDQIFVRGDLIRTLPPDEIAHRAEQLAQRLRENHLLDYDPLVTYLVALLVWHGCLNMAKSLRPTYVTPEGLVPYTRPQREAAYAFIKPHWQQAEAGGNPWVKYGVSLARTLETRRENRIIDDWVPRDSPYWD